jgi:hypothetical protein
MAEAQRLSLRPDRTAQRLGEQPPAGGVELDLDGELVGRAGPPTRGCAGQGRGCNASVATGLPGYTTHVLRSLRRLPFFKILAIGQVALLARRHFQQLDPEQRRRLAELVRRARSLSAEERRELREIVGRLEPRAFAAGAADAFSPLPLRRFGRRR